MHKHDRASNELHVSWLYASEKMVWHGLEGVEPLEDAKDKGLAQAQSTRLYIFYFSDPRSH